MKKNRVAAAPSSKKGFVTIYLVFAFLLLIPVVGLAIDMSVLYNVKGKLQAACDAAAIGAGNTLERSTSLSNPASVSAIQATAQRYFNANYQAGYWGSSIVSYSATPSENANTHVRTIVVSATESVPMLFMRVLGINKSTIATTATVSVRFVTMMIVVDRSGSVLRANANVDIQNALTTFVANANTSYLVDGRDVVGMGSFGGTWNLDAPPASNFRSGSPGIASAINSLPFGNNATNTSEGLYQAYHQLQLLNNTGALNVILLLTDGRPSAFSVNMSMGCYTGSKQGFISAIVGQTWPPLPPQTQGGYQGSSQIFNFGFGVINYQGVSGWGGGDLYPVSGSSGCQFNSNPEAINADVATFPGTDIHGNSTTSGYSPTQGQGTSMSNPLALRYASFNTADNQATTIRRDTTIRPVLFVIGLNEPPAGGEPLDADWLARVANDPGYIDSNGNSVFQSGQTSGNYYNVTAAGLPGAFQAIASQVLRLSQ